MSFISGYSKGTWHPVMTANTILPSYWINWRFLICVIWVLLSTIVAMILLRKNEDFCKSKRRTGEETSQQETAATLYMDETWRPCLKGIHPAWLLAYRVLAFFVLMILLVVTSFVDGGSIFYYYTQWTFCLITFYFGLGSILSIYGCYQYHKRVGGDKVDNVEVDAEQGTYVNTAPRDSNISNRTKNPDFHEEHVRQSADLWGYVFQIIFQMNAGAVVLTDCVFWLIMVPFLAQKDYNLNVLVVNMHSLNAIFLLGDTALNSLRFPLFRIAYFFLWTVVYVIFQWIVHACIKLWWPYPFLDLSSSYAPLWYFVVAAMHIPCYGGFALTMKLKHYLLSRWFPDSYQCAR